MWFMESESSRLRPHCAICERAQSSSWRDALSDNYLPCANIWSADDHPNSFILSLAFSDYLMYPQEMRRFDLSGIGLPMMWQASCSWGDSVCSPAFRRRRPISRNEYIAAACGLKAGLRTKLSVGDRRCSESQRTMRMR